MKFKESLRNWMTRLHTRSGVGMKRFLEADQVISSTNEMAEVFRDWGISSVVVPQIAMEDKKHDEIGVASSTRVEGDELKLLFVGSLHCWKGTELALQALSRLPDQATLTFIGSGPDSEILVKLSKRLGLTQRVHFLGRVSRSEVMELYAEFDVFFYPSLHDSGAFTVLEAMQAGLPVICLNRGGPALSVTKNCGMTVGGETREEVIKGLVDAVNCYYAKPELKQIHGSNARKRIRDYYNWETKAQSMMQIYNKVISDE